MRSIGFSSISRPRAVFLVVWTAAVFVALLLAVFLHEDGHGLGAVLDGVHVSTGFGQVGNAGRAPGDADFRAGTPGGVWTGLLGPASSWLLAIACTVALCRVKRPGLTALALAAAAIAAALVRAVPNFNALLTALAGRLYVTDEVYWGLWFVTHVCRPELAALDPLALAQTTPALFLREPLMWAAPAISFAICAACLAVAYRHALGLWRRELTAATAGLFVLLPLAAWAALQPLLDVLDRAVRITW